MEVDAPLASRATTMAGRLLPAAMCRGVYPLLSLAFIFLNDRKLRIFTIVDRKSVF